MRDDLDRFYTKPGVASECVADVDVAAHDVIVEPSAGAGSFSSQITDCYAFDLSPQDDSVMEKNWFDVTVDDFPEFENMLVIGNPPFGKRSTLAKGFIRHAISLGATTIAFILPKTFSKRTNQSVFPPDWRFIHEIDLGQTKFELIDHGEIFIPCSFYVWTRNADMRPGVDLRVQLAPKPQEFRCVGRGDTTADFAINGNNGRVRSLNEITNSKAEHFIKVNDGYDAETLRTQLSSLDFTFYSSVNGGVAWINRDDIHRAWAMRAEET